MSKFALQSLGFVLVLACAGLSAHAQRGPRRPPIPVNPEEGRCWCSAEGAECLFGSANGCQTDCPPGQLCDCKGASCTLGFPRASRCRCLAEPRA